MPALTTIGLIGGLIGTGLAGAQVASSIDQGRLHKIENDQALAEKKTQDDALIKEQTDRAANEESQAEAVRVRDQANDRRRQLTAGFQGRRSTILTSPLGVPGYSGGGAPKKTLLGV